MKLYVITDDRGHLKIGIARNPTKRCAELQTGNPYSLRVAAEWQFLSSEDAYGIEQILLARSMRHALRGEWIGADSGAVLRWASRYHAAVMAGKKIKASSREMWGARAPAILEAA